MVLPLFLTKLSTGKCNALHILTTGGPDVVFDFGDYVMSSADKTMYENTLSIALIEFVLKI